MRRGPSLVFLCVLLFSSLAHASTFEFVIETDATMSGALINSPGQDHYYLGLVKGILEIDEQNKFVSAEITETPSGWSFGPHTNLEWQDTMGGFSVVNNEIADAGFMLSTAGESSGGSTNWVYLHFAGNIDFRLGNIMIDSGPGNYLARNVRTVNGGNEWHWAGSTGPASQTYFTHLPEPSGILSLIGLTVMGLLHRRNRWTRK